MHMEKVVPSAYKAMLGLEKYCVANVDPTVLELVKLRASMVNVRSASTCTATTRRPRGRAPSGWSRQDGLRNKALAV